jgi:hypothetical protein
MSNPTNIVELQAKEFLDARASIIESAKNLAEATVERLKEGSDVQISLEGLNGIPSSYFNVVLLRLIGEFGVEAVKLHVKFQLNTEAQRFVFQRSFDAAAKSVA